MYEYKEGAKRESICSYCEKSVASTLTRTTLSLCKGLEEVDNVIVNVCDECGNLISTPARSLPPIQLAMKRLVESGVVSERGEIPVELKSIMDKEKGLEKESKSDFQEEYPLIAAE